MKQNEMPFGARYGESFQIVSDLPDRKGIYHSRGYAAPN